MVDCSEIPQLATVFFCAPVDDYFLIADLNTSTLEREGIGWDGPSLGVACKFSRVLRGCARDIVNGQVGDWRI